MKITFIDPPNFLTKRSVERVFGCAYTLYPFPNIFSLSAAALLEKEGYRVRYIDMANEGWKLKKVKRFIKEDDSDILVFHSVNLSMMSDLFIFRMIREINNNIITIFTGPAPTYFKENFLRDSNSIVIRGETEVTLSELVNALKTKSDLDNIEGISFVKEGKIIDNTSRPLVADLDKLPFPARHFLKRNLYYNPKLPRKPFTVVQTSRNCPYQCIFCVPNAYSFACELEYKKYNENKKPPVRLRSPQNVIEEFKLLAKEGYKSVSIIDDQFLWEEKRTIAICEGIKNLDVQWGCLARADKIAHKIAKKMKESGCLYIDIGVESFSQEVLDDIRKDLEIEKVYETVKILKKYNILAKINLMLGVSPLQTEETIKKDINIAKRLGVDAVMFSIATPFPGTEFYKRAKDNNLFVDKDYRPANVQSRSIIRYPHLSESKLDRLVKRANFYFYFSPEFFIKNLRRLFLPLNLYYSLLALKRKFF